MPTPKGRNSPNYTEAKALITADWHLSASPRDEYRFLFVEKTLPDMIEEFGVELLLFLGDVCEVKDGHEAELVNRVAAAFQRLSRLCPIVFVQGNHDWLSSPNNPFFGFLSRLSGGGISWVQAPTPLAAVKNVPEGFRNRSPATIILPHTADYERDWADIQFENWEVALAHQSFSGAKSESGFELGGVPMSYFPKGLKIVSGDIHRPQDWGALTYVGAPYNVDFGDEIDPRVLIWDGKTFESVPVPGPQKRLLEMGLNDVVLPQGDCNLNKGDLVKVRVEVGSYDEWPGVKAELEAWALKRGVILHQAQPIIRPAGIAKAPSNSRGVLSDEEVFKSYAKNRQLAAGYVSTGQKLL